MCFVNFVFIAVKRQLLQFQSPISGLFPVLSTDTEVGSVRDSVYCAAAVWSLYQAYRWVSVWKINEQWIFDAIPMHFIDWNDISNEIFVSVEFQCFISRIDDDRGKSHELGQTAVKCMRGILECWIKQAHRVELFKQRQSNQHALHSKFHLHTGEEIYSDDVYNHLQIDVVSIYLIFLVQMITSGLQIIYTQVIHDNFKTFDLIFAKT